MFCILDKDQLDIATEVSTEKSTSTSIISIATNQETTQSSS